MNIFRKIGRFIAQMPRRYSIGGGAVILVAIILIVHFAAKTPSTDVAASGVSHVKIASVASLSSQTGPLPVVGNVTSLSEANVLAQSSGEIVSLSRALGDHVAAGAVIAQFDNSSQEAAVLQAQGAYDAAEANLTKASGSTAANSSIGAAQASQGAANAQTSALATLQNTAAALDDAVNTKSDTLFTNSRSAQPALLSTIIIPDSQLVIDIENERAGLNSVLADADSLATNSDIDASAGAMLTDAQKVATFLNSLVAGVNDAVPSGQTTAATIASYQAAVGAARSEVLAAISSLTAAKNAYDAAQSGAQTASNSATGTGSDIAVAQANVKQAQGALGGAKANLEKTIIRSPISGTIISLPITQGDFVSAFSPVAQISNPSALEIETYVTPDDAKTLSVGGGASIGGGVAHGVIVSIAPALDPTTGKIEVKIGIVGDQSALTDGDTVTVSLDRSEAKAPTKAVVASQIVIPIIAAKITPQGPVVFTVASSTLVANPIALGTILGSQVVVSKGLTPEMAIVTDARGLSAGQVVVVDSQ